MVRMDSLVRRDSMMLQEPTTITLVRTRSQYPSLAMITPSSVVSPLHEFSAPQFMEFTESKNRRVLIDHFCNVLSHLIVLKEDDGNPFRKLLLPLSYSSSPVLNAIYALSSAHLEYRGVQNEEKSLGFHNKALQGLTVLIDQNNHANREEVLAAIILLVYYEVVSVDILFLAQDSTRLTIPLVGSARQFEYSQRPFKGRNDGHAIPLHRIKPHQPLSRTSKPPPSSSPLHWTD